MSDRPRLIKLDPADNVAVVANDDGLPKGTQVDGLTLTEDVPQAHKVALSALEAGALARLSWTLSAALDAGVDARLRPDLHTAHSACC